MIVGIDGNEANEVRADIGAPAGVNVYAFELLKAIYKLQDEWKGTHEVVVYLKREPSPLLPKPTTHFRYKVLGGKGMWVLTKLTPHLLTTREKPDVLFSPSHYAPLVTTMPRVCSIMDLGYLTSSAHFKKKDFWQLKYWTARSIAGSKAVFAISQSTKDDIVRHYPSAKDKVVVTHLGYDEDRFKSTLTKAERVRLGALKTKYSIGPRYVLFLSVLKPSKNVEGLVTAWSKIVNEFPDFSLVIGGKKGWMFDQIDTLVKKFGLSKSIIFTDYVAEEDKPIFFKGAELFVLPSFWEGFGLDVLNAMAVGTPVAVSKVGALPEVAGDAGVYFDPKDTGDIANKIKKVLSLGKVDYNKLVAKSLNQAKKFSWEDTAKKTLEVLEQAANLK